MKDPASSVIFIDERIFHFVYDGLHMQENEVHKFPISIQRGSGAVMGVKC